VTCYYVVVKEYIRRGTGLCMHSMSLESTSITGAAAMPAPSSHRHTYYHSCSIFGRGVVRLLSNEFGWRVLQSRWLEAEIAVRV
jgi:hypothetical protein